MIELSEEQVEKFKTDGFVILEGVLSDKDISAVRSRFEPLFSGTFEPGCSRTNGTGARDATVTR